MKKLILVAASVTFSLGLVACSQTNTTETDNRVQTLTSGIEMANFDHSVRPQDDFYRYVDGNWLKKIKIPADQSNYSSFFQVYEQTEITLRKVVQDAAAKPNKASGSSEQKLGDLYTSFMDQQKINALGLSPLANDLNKIANLSSAAQLSAAFAYFNHMSVNTPFRWTVDNDAKMSSQYAISVSQSGLGLPDRDYYLKDTEKFKKLRQDYQGYMAQVLSMAGYSGAKQAAQGIMTLETALAKSQWSRVERRDPQKAYNKLSFAELDKLLGQISWADYAKTAGLDKASEVIVEQPTYLSGFATIYSQTSLQTFKDYLSFHLINDYATSLYQPMADLHFEFFSKRLTGVQEQSPRWRRGIEVANAIVGEVLGELYVKAAFPPEAKRRMEVMVKNLIKAYSKRIAQLEWMSPETKQSAQQKLAKFTYKIGYPDKFKDYSALEIKADDLVGNGMRSSRWQHDDLAAKLGTPMDKSIWHMNPQRVNAYYNPVLNEIVFPAAILQPPFFNMAAEDSVNYGAIGAVIGHELGHGFDDSGAQYDGDGNLRDWWTDADKREFEKRGKQFSEQFSAFKPFDDAHVNGELTLGENIGDLGGMTVAYEALQIALDGKEAPVLDGFTADQRFFFGWAQVWRRKYREEELRKRLMTDSHSPSEYRVNGIMWNMPEFYKTFDVKPGDKLYLPPEQRVTIW
ncbi:MAG: putative endopeptidase [Phenylobacterium sp.]|jgi:putative endopeptidase